MVVLLRGAVGWRLLLPPPLFRLLILMGAMMSKLNNCARSLSPSCQQRLPVASLLLTNELPATVKRREEEGEILGRNWYTILRERLAGFPNSTAGLETERVLWCCLGIKQQTAEGNAVDVKLIYNGRG